MSLSRLVFRAGCGIRLYRFQIIAFLSTLQLSREIYICVLYFKVNVAKSLYISLNVDLQNQFAHFIVLAQKIASKICIVFKDPILPIMTMKIRFLLLVRLIF